MLDWASIALLLIYVIAAIVSWSEEVPSHLKQHRNHWRQEHTLLAQDFILETWVLTSWDSIDRCVGDMTPEAFPCFVPTSYWRRCESHRSHTESFPSKLSLLVSTLYAVKCLRKLFILESFPLDLLKSQHVFSSISTSKNRILSENFRVPVPSRINVLGPKAVHPTGESFPLKTSNRDKWRLLKALSSVLTTYLGLSDETNWAPQWYSEALEAEFARVFASSSQKHERRPNRSMEGPMRNRYLQGEDRDAPKKESYLSRTKP